MSSRSFAAASNQYLRKINAPVGIRAVCGWAKTDTSGTQTIWYQENKPFSNPVNFVMRLETVASAAVNKLVATISDTGGGLPVAVTSSNTVPLNAWFHFGIRFDHQIANRLYVYANGTETTSGDTSGISQQNAPRHALASTFAGGTYFNGQIANVVMWGSLMTDNHMILSHYGNRAFGSGQASGSYIMVAESDLSHDDFNQFGERVAGGGAPWSWTAQNSPTFSNDDPGVNHFIGLQM